MSLRSAIASHIDNLRSVLPKSVRDAISLSALKPRFRISSRRVAHNLANRVYNAEVLFDDGFIEAAGRAFFRSRV
jgi:hypothetical protein